MKKFDMVFTVHRKEEECSTKWVSCKERLCLLELYNELGTLFLPTLDGNFEISGDSFEEDVNKTAQELADCLQKKYYIFR